MRGRAGKRRGKTGNSAPSPAPSGILRVLDANLNRAREGLRVLEDTARFIWGAKPLFETLRALRHGLDRATRSAYPRLVASRDSGGDMGRAVPEERKRDWPGLVAANFRRAEEALRVMEEYGKVFSPGHAARFKALRYRLYSAEKAALLRLAKPPLK